MIILPLSSNAIATHDPLPASEGLYKCSAVKLGGNFNLLTLGLVLGANLNTAFFMVVELTPIIMIPERTNANFRESFQLLNIFD